jgi:hypothetical protein
MNTKLDVGRVFERIFQIYRDQFGLLMGSALVLFVPVAIVNGFLYEEGGFLASIVASAIAIVATYWYQGMVVEAARDILDGRRDHTIGSLFSAARPVVATLIGAGILAGIAIAIGLVLLIVPGLYLLTIWAVIVPVIVLERTGVFGAFGRSRELVKGHGWQVFGVLVVLFLAALVLRLVIQVIIDGITDSVVGFIIAELIVNILVVPLSALAAAVIYFELKAIKGEPVLGTGAGGQLPDTGAPAAEKAAPGAGAPGASAPGSEAPRPAATGPEEPRRGAQGPEGGPTPGS